MADMATTAPMATGAGGGRRGLLWLRPRLVLGTVIMDTEATTGPMAMATGEGRRGRQLRSPGQSLCLRLRLMPSPGMATTDTEDTEATTEDGATAATEATTGVRKEFYNKKQ